MTPKYDRELIARMLRVLLPMKLRPYSCDAISEQIRLLREADNADAAGVHTAKWEQPAAPVAVDALAAKWRTYAEQMRPRHAWYAEGMEDAADELEAALAQPKPAASGVVDDAMKQRAGIYCIQAKLPITSGEMIGLLEAALAQPAAAVGSFEQQALSTLGGLNAAYTGLFGKKPAQPKPDETCLCPIHGEWIAAADVRRLTRELDVAINGEEGAARQASLCDIVAQVKRTGLVARAAKPEEDGVKFPHLDDVSAQYWELIYAVESKYEGESRHETALRYIREREARCETAVAEATPPPDEGDD